MTTGETAVWVPTPMRSPPAEKLSFEEFHDWLDEDTWAEWVNGEVQMVSPASLRHQQLASFLWVLLDAWIEVDDMGIVLQAPFLMRLPPPLDRAREPDLLFVAKEHRDRLHATYLDGPADLVIEIGPPNADACLAILQSSLRALAAAFPGSKPLADDPRLKKLASRCVGLDGRQLRKAVFGACALELQTALRPETLTFELLARAVDVARTERDRLKEASR